LCGSSGSFDEETRVGTSGDATGAILTLTCAYGLRRNQKRYGIVTMCIGGGQEIALVLEAV
jgi:acetyl-CoA acetyltransferase